MKKLFLLLPLLSGCKTPDVDALIKAVPGYEFAELTHDSGTIGNTYNTEVKITGAKIENDTLHIESLTIGNKNTAFNFKTTIKGLKRPLSTAATSATGN